VIDLGVDIGGTKMLMIARDAGGALVNEVRVPTGPESSPESLEAAIEAFVGGRPIRTAAVAVPGLVGETGDVVESDVLPGIRGWRPRVAGRLPFVVNDVRASLAYAATTTDVLCVVAGTAIAAAFTNSGTTEPFRGGAGWAGELGYQPTPSADGSWTTLDEVAGGAAILRRLGLSAAQVHEQADDQRVAEEVASAGAAPDTERFVAEGALLAAGRD
jgi:predicted NBD/HSP70 family sugar kinase